LAARIERHLSDPLVVNGEELVVTASTGVFVQHPDGEVPDIDELMHRAGQALRRAKAAGKNRHTVFDMGLHLEAGRRRSAEAALRHALLADEIEVAYQPVVDLGSGVVLGAEALCRLRTPDGEQVSPALFIDIAEENGSIGALGHLVLERAVRQCVQWHAAGRADLHIAVNVSATQTTEKGYAAGVLTVLSQAGLSPKHLILELTESALIDASPTTVAALESLRAAGVGIAIDDFGTGYASLRYVQQLPVTALKIDISFTRGLPHGRQEQAIVRAVAQLARTLELACVAEGIETSEQRDFLAELGVCGQGYLLGRPGSGADILLLDT
ncbi:MAG: uncharacterized protein JWO22_1160, partial [Frankiales bacterium]|nr:uncharacterized protein [Frankiales bacterium]